jgi:glycosyltransferase involved in cell wall biosynthesis
VRVTVTGYPRSVKYGGDLLAARVFDELGRMIPLKKVRARYYPGNIVGYWAGALLEAISAFLTFPDVVILQGTPEAQILASGLLPWVRRVMLVYHWEQRTSSHQRYQGWVRRRYAGALKAADLIITISGSSREELIRVLKVDGGKVKVVTPGLDRLELPETAKDIDFLLMGRAGKFSLLQEIAKEITKRKGDAKICLTGPVDPKVPDVEYLGFVSDRAKSSTMARAKVLLHPSDREGYSLTVAESLSAGIPVVAWDLPVFQELYGGSRDVVLVPRGEVEAFAEEAIRLLGRRPEARRHGVTWTDTAGEMLKLLQELDSRGRGPRHPVA